MSDNTLANDMVTDTSDDISGNQAQTAKTYTQEEVDNMMARMRGSLEKKLLKPYQDLGDPEQLRQIKSDWERKQEEAQVKRGEFERILQEKAQRWESEIQKRDSVIKEYKVNTPLLSAAAKYRAVAPEQVKALLSQNVRLNGDGEVEVIDEQGKVRYTDSGQPLDVDTFVGEWLTKNPHFVQPTPATTNTKSNVSQGSDKQIDVSKLDMTKPEHRKLYKDYRKTAGLA